MSKLSSDMSSVTVAGLDLAKHVFQVHCVDGEGRVVVNRSLRRREVLTFFRRLPPCRVGMEACGSAHHWGSPIAASPSSGDRGRPPHIASTGRIASPRRSRSARSGRCGRSACPTPTVGLARRRTGADGTAAHSDEALANSWDR